MRVPSRDREFVSSPFATVSWFLLKRQLAMRGRQIYNLEWGGMPGKETSIIK